jgi:hypothetical protein
MLLIVTFKNQYLQKVNPININEHYSVLYHYSCHQNFSYVYLII